MKIQISDRQRDGVIVVIVIAVITYTLTFSSLLFPSKICDLPYRDTGHDQLVVGITGDTISQGIYWLPRNAKVRDLLEAAGIENIEKFDEKILHGRLSTGNAVFIESDSRIKIGEINNASKVALNIPININKATLEELMLIPGIGEKTASQIIQFRETSGNFRSIEDLMKIRGIKEKKFAKLKKYFFTDRIS
jgi:competence protein ComEA